MEYTPDNESRMRKRSELISLARDQLGTEMARHAQTMVDSFCRLSAPQDPPIVVELITLDRGGRGGGRTRKPGNIVMNWKNLFRESADLILTGVGSAAQPWLIPLAALSIFNKLYTHATIELSKEHASCLFALWHRCDENHRIERPKALEACNELFAVYQWPLLQDPQFSTLLDDLIRIRCVEMDQKKIWLREWVRISYS